MYYNPGYYPDKLNSLSPQSPAPSHGSSSVPTSSTLAFNDDKIFFVAIIRGGDEALVKFAHFAGNYDDILGQVLPKVVKTNGIKMTLNYERYNSS